MRRHFVVLATLALAACGFIPKRGHAPSALVAAGAKQPPLLVPFQGCPPEGTRFDHELNKLKNRADTSDHYIPITFDEIARIPWPVSIGYGYRVRWTPKQRDAVWRYEGLPVSAEGSLVALRRIQPEPTNCGSHRESMRDFHLWMSATAGSGTRHSVVAEVTPRFRAAHPAWTLARLDSLRATGARLRVSGWLMLDHLHPELVGIRRATLWEIHPITRIEVQGADGAWVTLDSLVVPNASGR